MDSFLTRPGNLVFSTNRALLASDEPGGLRVVRQPSGHVVVYGPQGRRMLATDPDGHPLHECEWSAGPTGGVTLARARLRLDWGQWIGLKPQGLVSRTVLDLSKKPGWQRLRADDLREMAARAMGVPYEEVRFFYGDEDLLIDGRGQATIRHAKDAFYVLDGGTFEAGPEAVRFMACMGAMHWAEVDFLPVVELFQSLLPGTGSAAFELIRGLYDDQSHGRTPRPLRYRGIPPYPSEAAYRLFSGFFAPRAAEGRDPFPIFMDTARSHEVTWLPIPDPPLRYFDEEQRCCVTVQAGIVQKVTIAEDPAGLSFVNPGRGGFAPCGRNAGVTAGRLELRDGDQVTSLPLQPSWGVIKESLAGPAPVPDWRAVFVSGPPSVTPREAYSAVLLYPEDATEIEEAATQPFVADYLEDKREASPELAASLARSEHVLIDGFEAALGACISLDRPRDHTVLFLRQALAQKQAQQLWNRLARRRCLDWLPHIQFVSGEDARAAAYRRQYDLIYLWVPFVRWGEPQALARTGQEVAAALRPGGMAFVSGPQGLAAALQAAGLRVMETVEGETLPTLRMHRTILPRARLKTGLTLFRLGRD